MAEAARQTAKRRVTLGISDHGLRDNRRLQTQEQIDAYRHDLARYPVLRGIEISVGDVASGVSLDGLDYVIASLHMISVSEGLVHASRYHNYRSGLYPRYNPTVARYDRLGYFEAWLQALAATAARWPVTILGHFCLLPELANTAGTYELHLDPEPDGVAWEWLDATIELCLRHDIAIELNAKSRVPHEAFVRRALERGARFSLGSDAHQLWRAGNLSFGRHLVEKLGIPRRQLLSVADVLGDRSETGVA